MSRPLLEAEGLALSWARRGITGSGRPTPAVDGVDLAVGRGESVGIVGESGSGKSTLARLLVGLERPDRGRVLFDGQDLAALAPQALRTLRRRFQLVLQDAGGSLDPLLRVETTVAEPLLAHGLATRGEVPARVAALLDAVGLPARTARLRPGSLSGGERQRVALARALATGPELLVLDEPVSALDASIRGRILALLAGLRERLGLTLVVISHEPGTIRRLCPSVAVMYAGSFVETGPTDTVLAAPAHPYTAALLASEPELEAGAGLPSQPPPPRSGEGWPQGACAFASRCPLARERCTRRPPLAETGPGHRVACWEVAGE